MLVENVSADMVKATQAKFDLWDKVMNEEWLSGDDVEKRQRAYLLLRDPTIYAYSFFRDPLHPKKRFKLYPYQDLMINDPHSRIFFASANQVGKSITLCLLALTYALQNPGKTVLMTSKTLPQSKDLLRQIRLFLQSSPISYKYDIGDSETKTEIYFRHFDEVVVHDDELDRDSVEYKELPQSRIICVPATEAALGYAVHLALVDELCFYENGEYFYKQILQPRTYTTKGRIVVFSNPNGQQGIGWDLWNDPTFHRYSFNFLDCPTNTQEEFDKLSRSLTREQIDSTLLAKFTDPEGGFITLAERKDMQEARSSILPSLFTSPVYIFFDWAKSRDRTVRIIGIPVHKSDKDWADEVYVYEMKEYPQGTPYTKIIDEDLKHLIVSTGFKNVAMVGWDNTGVGRGLEDFVKRIEQLGIQAMPVEFTLENKSRIYTLFKLLAEQRRIKIPYVRECDKQLSTLRFKKPEGSRHLKVHHLSEKDRDDFPDALAGLCSLIIQPENPPISVTIV